MRNKDKDIKQLERENLDLKQQIQFKNREMEDLQFSLNALKKQQCIWEHLNQPKSETERQYNIKTTQQQNQKLKKQLMCFINEKQAQEKEIQELKQKIKDLKYTNQELKNLNDKSHFVYEKEIEMLKSKKSSEEVTTLKKEKEKLQQTLHQCEKIAKEMQPFYMNQIKSLQSSHLSQIETYKKEKQQLLKQIHGQNQEIKELKSSMEKNEYKMRQSVIEELVKVQSQQKRCQLMLQQLKERYEREIAELKDKIKFLIVKLESVQDSKYFNEGSIVSTFNETNLSNSLMPNKMSMSSATSESFRFTPGNSFSSSIKESLSRRDTNSMRTPNKYKNIRNFGKYLEHTNA